MRWGGGGARPNKFTNKYDSTLVSTVTISYFLSCGRELRSETLYPTEHYSYITVTRYQACLRHRITTPLVPHPTVFVAHYGSMGYMYV